MARSYVTLAGHPFDLAGRSSDRQPSL